MKGRARLWKKGFSGKEKGKRNGNGGGKAILQKEKKEFVLEVNFE